MANYSLTVNSTFNPYSLQELLPIYQANAQAQYQAEDAISQLQIKADQWEKLANNAQDADVYNTYKAYSNQLKAAADDIINNGVNTTSRRNLMNMRAQYASNIIPIEEAYNKRQQQAQVLWQARLQDPTLIAQDPSELGLSYYMKNPTYTPQSYSGKLLTAQSAQAAQNLAKTLSSYGKGEPIDSYTNTFIQKHGLTRNDIQKYLNGETNATNKVLGAIYQQVYDSSQIGNWANENQRRQAANFIKQGMWSAIGQDTVQAMENFEARENYKFQQQLALAQAQQQQNQLAAINEVLIYTPEEQKEADKMREKYKQYFYTKNGRTYLSQKGREEYEKQKNTLKTKTNNIPGKEGKFTQLGMNLSKVANTDFYDFLNSIGAQKYLGKGNNWQPGNVGNLWSKYISTGVRGDAKQYMEYDYALSPTQQTAYKNQIAAANIGRDRIYAAKFDRKSGTWKKDKDIDLADFLNEDNKWTVTNARFGAQGRTYIAKNKKGEVIRFVMPVGINPNVEKNIDKRAEDAMNISKTLQSGKLNGKPLTDVQKAQLRQAYNNAIQQAYLFQSQLGVLNNTSTQDFAAQAYE